MVRVLREVHMCFSELAILYTMYNIPKAMRQSGKAGEETSWDCNKSTSPYSVRIRSTYSTTIWDMSHPPAFDHAGYCGWISLAYRYCGPISRNNARYQAAPASEKETPTTLTCSQPRDWWNVACRLNRKLTIPKQWISAPVGRVARTGKGPRKRRRKPTCPFPMPA